MNKDKEKINLTISKENLAVFKNLSIFIVSVGLIIISGVIIFLPNLKRVLEEQGKLINKRKELGQLTQKANLLGGIDSFEIKRKQASVEGALLTEKDVEVVFKNLKLLAGKAGVSLVSMNVAPGEISTAGAGPKEEKTGQKKTGEKNGSFETTNYQVQAKGKFEDLKKFFDLIHTTSPVMAIGGISLSLPEDPEQLIPVNLVIKTYVSGMAKAPPSLQTPLSQLNEEEEKVYNERVLKLTKY